MSQRLPERDYLGTETFSLYKSDLLLKDSGLMTVKAIPVTGLDGPLAC